MKRSNKPFSGLVKKNVQFDGETALFYGPTETVHICAFFVSFSVKSVASSCSIDQENMMQFYEIFAKFFRFAGHDFDLDIKGNL